MRHDIRDLFDYRYNPVLFVIWSYQHWIRGIWGAWRKDVAKSKRS